MASVKCEVTLDASKYIDALERARAALKAIDEPSELTKRLRNQVARHDSFHAASGQLVRLHGHSETVTRDLLTISERQDRLEAFAIFEAANRTAQLEVSVHHKKPAAETKPHTDETFRAACNIPKGTQLGIDQWLRTIAPRSLAHNIYAGRASEDIVEGDLIIVTFNEHRQIIKTVNADYHVGVDMANGPDFAAMQRLSVKKVAQFFRVPPELLRAPFDKPEPEVPKIGAPFPSVSAADMKITYKSAECVITPGLIDRTMDLALEYSRESEPPPLPAPEPESKPVKFREFL